ncbi:unnamed protein product [Trichobilharzia regenti]|nr:unnamed protein product [Trichobilharzia regenti]
MLDAGHTWGVLTGFLDRFCIGKFTSDYGPHSSLKDYPLALGNLIHITAGPLVILSNSFCLTPMTNLSTQALDGLLKATFLYYPECLPRIFFTESNNITSCEQLSRLAKYIADDDDAMNLEILASYLSLFTTTITKLPSVELLLTQSPPSSLTISSTGSLFGRSNWEVEKKKKFLPIIYFALPNLCLAIGRAWLCLNCTSQLM